MEAFGLSPIQPIDWRWRAALRIAYHGRISRKRDDELTARAVRFIRARDRVTTRRRLLALRRKHPDILGAVQLAEGSPRDQLELRGRILARQTPEEISDEMGLHEGEIEAYQGLFFDVGERLGATRYIMAQVIGVPLGAPPTLEQMALISAWRHGPLVLDAYLGYIDRQHDPTLPRRAKGSDAWRNDLAIEVQMAAQNASLTPEAKKNYLKVCAIVQEMVNKREMRPTIGQILRRTIRQYLQASHENQPNKPAETPESQSAPTCATETAHTA